MATPEATPKITKAALRNFDLGMIFAMRTGSQKAILRHENTVEYYGHLSVVWQALNRALLRDPNARIEWPGQHACTVEGIDYEQAEDGHNSLFIGKLARRGSHVDRDMAVVLPVWDPNGYKVVAAIGAHQSAEADFKAGDRLGIFAGWGDRYRAVQLGKVAVAELEFAAAEVDTVNIGTGTELIDLLDASGWQNQDEMKPARDAAKFMGLFAELGGRQAFVALD